MVEMKVLGSHEEWLKARTKIGGSDASAIFGMSPYKTNVDLFKEKAYGIEPEDISDKPYVKYGTEAEKHLRELFKLDYPQYQVGYVENNMFTNDKYPWAHASLDGWLTEKSTGRKGVARMDRGSYLLSYQHITPTLHFRSARISRFFQLHFSVRVYSFHHPHSSDTITWSHSTIQRLVSRKLSSRWDIRDIFSWLSVLVSIRD